MFNFLKKDNSKISEKDLGVVEDAFEFLKHAISDESHCLNEYMESGDEKDLKSFEEARKERTVVMDMVVVVKGNCWCRSKHLPGKAMSVQELIARKIQMGDDEGVKKLCEIYKSIYPEFLRINGYI